MTMAQVVALLLALAPYIAPPIVGAIAVLVKSAYEKMPASKQALATNVVYAVVSGLEQNSGLLAVNGPAKKQMALETAANILDHYGVKVSTDTLNSLIESCVYAINQSKAVTPVTGAALTAKTSITEG